MFKVLASLAALLLLACSGAEATGGIAVIGGDNRASVKDPWANTYMLPTLGLQKQVDTITPWETGQRKLQTHRKNLAAVSYHGLLYAIGGNALLNLPSSRKTVVDTIEILDVRGDGGWVYGPVLQSPRHYCAAAVLNGVIYVIGGGSGYDHVETMEMLVISDPDPRWSDGPKLLSPKRNSPAAVALNDKIFVMGGTYLDALDTVEILDTKNLLGGWSFGPTLKSPRNNHAAAAHNGIIYVIGGTTLDSNKFAPNMEMLDTNEVGAVWKNGPQLQTPRMDTGLAFSGDMLCAMGGYDSAYAFIGQRIDSVEMLDVSKSDAKWVYGLPLPETRLGFAAVAITANENDCVRTFSECTANCEAGDERTFTETNAQSGTGAPCPEAANCQPGNGACPALVHTSCDGTWTCDASCTASFNIVNAQSGNGAPCPTQHTCFTADCPSSEISATLGELTAPMQIEAGEYILVPDKDTVTQQDPSTVAAIFTVYAATRTTVELDCEVLMPSGFQDSFHVWFDDMSTSFAWKPGVFTSFTWVTVDDTSVGSSFELSAGPHTFHVGVREEGAQLRTLRITSGDAVFTTTNTGPTIYVPPDGPISPSLSPTPSPTLTPPGGFPPVSPSLSPTPSPTLTPPGKLSASCTTTVSAAILAFLGAFGVLLA